MSVPIQHWCIVTPYSDTGLAGLRWHANYVFPFGKNRFAKLSAFQAAKQYYLHTGKKVHIQKADYEVMEKCVRAEDLVP